MLCKVNTPVAFALWLFLHLNQFFLAISSLLSPWTRAADIYDLDLKKFINILYKLIVKMNSAQNMLNLRFRSTETQFMYLI